MPRIVQPRARGAQLARPTVPDVMLRRYPHPAQLGSAEAMRALDFAPVQARRAYRSYFGRAISLNAIEVALRQAWRGNMRALTDISRETLDTDPHLASVVSKRIEALAGLPYEIHPATGYGVDQAKALYYAAVVREQLSNLRNFRASLKQLAWALFDGRSALELQWMPVQDGMALGAYRVTWAVGTIAWIHPRRLAFGPMRELRVTDEYIGVSGDFSSYGFAIDPAYGGIAYKFMQWTPQLFGEYPEREGLAPRCLYWSFHKRFTARERMILVELFGKPWRIIEVDSESPAGDVDLQDADEIADALGSSYTARMPRGVNLKVVAPQRNAGQVHEDVIAECDRQISKLVLGQTGTTDPIKGGFNNQQANVMQDEQLAKLQGDAVEFSDVIEDQLCDPIIAMNFGEAETINAPKFVLRADLPTNRKEEIERLNEALKAGLQVSLAEAYAVSGFRPPDLGDPVLQMEQPPQPPNAPNVPAPRPLIVYPKGMSPDAGEQQPPPPVAAVGPGSMPVPSASAGAANANETITVNEDRAARGLPPIEGGDATIAEFAAKRAALAAATGDAVPNAGAPQKTTGEVPDPNPRPGNEPGQGASLDDPSYAPSIPGAFKAKPTVADIGDALGTRAQKKPKLDAGDALNPAIAALGGAALEPALLTIKHEGGKWRVYSEEGKSLGEYDTKAEALKRLRQVEYFKHKAAAARAFAEVIDVVGVEAAGRLALSVQRSRESLTDYRLAYELDDACDCGVTLASGGHADTKYGSPDDVMDRGEPEARRAVAKLVATIDAALEKVPGSVVDAYAAVNRARTAMDVHPLARVLERRMVHAAALGALDASLLDPQSVTAAAGEPKKPEPPFSKQKYDDALRAFRSKQVMRKSAFAQLEAKAKQRAFTVAGLAADEIVATVHDELVKQVAQGADIREFRAAMNARLKDAGWLEQLQTLGDGKQSLNASHVENVFRTNVMGAYNAGRAAQMSEPEVLKRRPVWQWRAAMNPYDPATGRGTRPTHAQANGLKMMATDAAWQRIYPPAGFRCVCRVVSLPADQTDGVVDGSTVTYLPDEGFVSNGIGGLG